MVDNYRAESFRVDRLKDSPSPSVYFANLEVAGEVHKWKRDSDWLEKAKGLISTAIDKSSSLRNVDVGKFVIAFPFGFAVYRFGTEGASGAEREIDSVCVKYVEYDSKF